jgi:hypothetical protein
MSKKKPVKRGANTAAPWVVGCAYFIRTVTMHVIGRLVAVYEHELVLEDAAWVADSGRFANALKTGALSEVEPFISAVIVGRGSIIDATEWGHALPRETK